MRTKVSSLCLFALAAASLGGCARDVVIKPAVISFNGNARATVDEARKQYDATLTRLNGQTADFIARHPDCGLVEQIVPRRGNVPPDKIRPGDPYCIDPNDPLIPETQKLARERLFVSDRSTFAVQFTALNLLIDYVTFLAKYADEPTLTSKSEIESTATAIKSFGQGISDLKAATGGSALKEFAEGGAVDQFSGAIGGLADQFEQIADQASDVSKLEGKIKESEPKISAALDMLVRSADLWQCAETERALIAAGDYANEWTPRLPMLDLTARKEIAARWIELRKSGMPDYCPGRSGGTTGHSSVGQMLVAIRTANGELVDIANHKYTPAQRKAIIEATLQRLGGVLTRAASLITLL